MFSLGALTGLVTGCGSTALTPPPVLETVSLAGDWELVRVVIETDEHSTYAVGEVETRALQIGEATCDQYSCSGTLITAFDVDVLESGNGSEAPYTWDGETFSYEIPPSSLDCSDTAGTVILGEAYDVTYDVSLGPDDDAATTLSGEMVISFGPAPATAAQLAELGCPEASGSTVFRAELARR